MIISDKIAKLLMDMLDQNDGMLEISRNELAGRIGCVPSQINYVITSRFTPALGYIVESRRGGGGYIRIIRKQMSQNEYLMHFYHAIGQSIDSNSTEAFINNLFGNNIITSREKLLIGTSLLCLKDDQLRADVFRQIILALMK